MVDPPTIFQCLALSGSVLTMGVAGRILITISVVAKTFLQLAVWNGICLTAVRVSTRMNPSMGQSLS
jgi:hypothetical protein